MAVQPDHQPILLCLVAPIWLSSTTLAILFKVFKKLPLREVWMQTREPHRKHLFVIIWQRCNLDSTKLLYDQMMVFQCKTASIEASTTVYLVAEYSAYKRIHCTHLFSQKHVYKQMTVLCLHSTLVDSNTVTITKKGWGRKKTKVIKQEGQTCCHHHRHQWSFELQEHIPFHEFKHTLEGSGNPKKLVRSACSLSSFTSPIHNFTGWFFSSWFKGSFDLNLDTRPGGDCEYPLPTPTPSAPWFPSA